MHPVLFALYPVLSLYASNVSLIPLSDVWAPCLIASVSAIALWAVFGLLLRDAQRGARIATALTLSFTSYSAIKALLANSGVAAWEDPRRNTLLTIWVLFAGVLTLLAAKKWKEPQRIGLVLNIAGACMCLFASVTIVTAHVSIRSEVAKATARSSGPATSTVGTPPDIFYIVLDGYGRDDVLQSVYGSSTQLGEELEKRGFYVATKAHSNYVQTELSLASSLNLSPVQTLIVPHGDSDRDRLALDRIIADSLASRTVKAMGYRTFAVTTGFPALTFHSYDVWIEHGTGESLFTGALIELTPIRRSSRQIDSMFDMRRTMIKGGFSEIARLADRSGAPRFVFAHILAPHPPFVFGPNGEPRRPAGAFSLSDGSHLVAQMASVDDYRRAYRDQAAYIGELLLETVDTLIARPGPAPIIIVQGDHGPKAELNQESAEGTNMSEAFSILSAYYAPTETRRLLYPSISPVNTMRVVFDSVFGMEFPVVKDESYFSTWSDPLTFIDVTDRVADGT